MRNLLGQIVVGIFFMVSHSIHTPLVAEDLNNREDIMQNIFYGCLEEAKLRVNLGESLEYCGCLANQFGINWTVEILVDFEQNQSNAKLENEMMGFTRLCNKKIGY